MKQWIPLSPEEKITHAELLGVANGMMGCPTDLSKLNDHQRVAIKPLAKKGYVALTSKWFMVVLKSDFSN